MKELPESTDFRTIRERGLLYVDKTGYIRELLRKQQCDYFLCRPRRFGKTLLIDTLETLFSGEREYFKGLHIDGTDYPFKKYPTVFVNFAFDPCGPDRLKELIVGRLGLVAKANNVKVDGSDPAEYMGNLIIALNKRFKSEVTVLVDEYDAPVVTLLDDLETAKANAEVVSAMLARIKQVDVGKYVRFTMVTGITRSALGSMGSGPNNLKDISLYPEYGGICGFTIDELDSYFADRMEPALASLQEAGVLGSSSNVGDLKNMILDWYDGYNWGGKQRVLNPLSIIRFFDTNFFTNHWVLTGRSTNLTTQMRLKAKDFLQIELEPYSLGDLYITDLEYIPAPVVLFQNGYLTIDKIVLTSIMNPVTKKEYLEYRYHLKYPNQEIETSYNADYFRAILHLKSDASFKPLAQELKTAFLNEDVKTISNMFNNFFSYYTYNQRLDSENVFHIAVQSLLLAMNFTVRSELPGYKGRLDLCVELEDQVFLVIELKYVPSPDRLTRKEEEEILATLAISRVDKDQFNGYFAKAVAKKLSKKLVFRIKNESSSAEEANKLLCEAALEILDDVAINKIQASAARKFLSDVEIAAALNDDSPTPDTYFPDQDVEVKLAEATNQALLDIASRDYHSIVPRYAKRIIDLGMALYDHRVGAGFGPATPPPAPKKPGRSKRKAPEDPQPSPPKKPERSKAPATKPRRG